MIFIRVFGKVILSIINPIAVCIGIIGVCSIFFFVSIINPIPICIGIFGVCSVFFFLTVIYSVSIGIWIFGIGSIFLLFFIRNAIPVIVGIRIITFTIIVSVFVFIGIIGVIIISIINTIAVSIRIVGICAHFFFCSIINSITIGIWVFGIGSIFLFFFIRNAITIIISVLVITDSVTVGVLIFVWIAWEVILTILNVIPIGIGIQRIGFIINFVTVFYSIIICIRVKWVSPYFFFLPIS